MPPCKARSSLRVAAARKLCQNPFSRTEPVDGITDREREVLTLVGRGLSNTEIAEELTSVRYGAVGGTAYHHVSDLYIALFTHSTPSGSRPFRGSSVAGLITGKLHRGGATRPPPRTALHETRRT